MDEVDNCVSLLAMARDRYVLDSVPKLEKSVDADSFSGLRLELPENQGKCLPPITSLLKVQPHPANRGMQLRSQGLISDTSDDSDCEYDVLETSELLDDSFTDVDPGLPPVASSVTAKFASSSFYSKKKKTKTPRPRAPVYRRCKNPELKKKIMESCSSLLAMSFKKEQSCVTITDENVAEADENCPIIKDVGPVVPSESGSDSETDIFSENERENSYYYNEATQDSDHSCQDMELDDMDENICQQSSCPEMEDGMELAEDEENEARDVTEETPTSRGACGYTGEKPERTPLGDVTNQWVPISEDTSIITSTIIPSQEADRALCNQSPIDPSQHSQYRFRNHFTTPISQRPCPLPSLDWANPREVWTAMLKKETLYYRNPQFLKRHPMLQSKMRSILLDWMTEVCEVYRLHRETYHLAVDFLDRYLTNQENTVKQQLQLIGITALFIAAKAEEIYPPKLTDFAYVTDGACSEEEILQQELVMLKVLNWDLTPMTPNAWLNLYLQLLNMDNLEDQEHGFIFPQYSAHAFIQIARLLDLSLLDLGSLQFTYSTLATTAISHMLSENVALSLSGYQQMDIAACHQWMLPLAMTINEMGLTELQYFPNINPDDAHNIQMHSVGMDHLEIAQAKTLALASQSRSSPDVLGGQLGVLTPPQSGKKCQESLV